LNPVDRVAPPHSLELAYTRRNPEGPRIRNVPTSGDKIHGLLGGVALRNQDAAGHRDAAVATFSAVAQDSAPLGEDRDCRLNAVE
jgi:hypothetical protein